MTVAGAFYVYLSVNKAYLTAAADTFDRLVVTAAGTFDVIN